MTKNRLVAIAAFLAVRSAMIAGNVLRTGQISPFSIQGFGALGTHVVSFVGVSFLVLTVRQKFWRIGGILAALSAFSRSFITSFPDHRITFGILTLVISSASIAALVTSWRLEAFDFNWWDRNYRIFLVLGERMTSPQPVLEPWCSGGDAHQFIKTFSMNAFQTGLQRHILPPIP